MSRLVLDDFSTSWDNDGPSSLWTPSLISAPDPAGDQGAALRLVAAAGSGSPFVRRVFADPRDLSAYQEVHLCVRSNRPADGTPARPFYLAAEFYATSAMTPPFWQRLLPVRAAGVWEFHELWIGDMPAAVRQSAGVFVIRSVGGAAAFEATIHRLVAVQKEPIVDADSALLRRLHNKFSIEIAGVATSVPAVIDHPENPSPPPRPYFSISPWTIRLQSSRAGSGEIIDNYTATGACHRQSGAALDLEYRVDVFTDERVDKASLLGRVATDLARRPLLEVYGRPVECVCFWPAKEELLQAGGLGRTPLFCRFTIPLEIADRVVSPAAVPFLRAGHLDQIQSAEIMRS